MTSPSPSAATLRAAALAGIVVVGILAVTATAPRATHQPADKMAVSGSTVEVFSAGFAPPLGGLLPGASADPDSDQVALLEGTLRTSSPTDLIFRTTAECALWTNITTVGNDDSEAIATVRLWIELDGQPVPVATGDPNEGRVVFCNRAFRMQTEQFDDEDATIHQFLRTRTANAFNWMALNVGPGIHTVTLQGELTTQVTGTGDAKAAVGSRTLIVEPVKLANDATV